MHIDKLKQEDGWYKDEEGCDYETAEDYLHGKILNFCMCGCPEENLQFVKKALQHIENLRLVWDEKQTYDNWKVDGLKLFGSDEVACFVYYVLDEKGLTEHGGSVPGWLTKEGRELLEDIDELYALERKP